AEHRIAIGIGLVVTTHFSRLLFNEAHEEALTRSPVSENSDRERRKYTAGSNDCCESSGITRDVEFICASVDTVGIVSSDGRWCRSDEMESPLGAVIFQPPPREILVQFASQHRNADAFVIEELVRSRILRCQRRSNDVSDTNRFGACCGAGKHSCSIHNVL